MVQLTRFLRNASVEGQAQVAQWPKAGASNPPIAGSNPALGTTFLHYMPKYGLQFDSGDWLSLTVPNGRRQTLMFNDSATAEAVGALLRLACRIDDQPVLSDGFTVESLEPPPSYLDDLALLQESGWTVECESPFEIRHDDGSFATENAAKAVVFSLRNGPV